MKKQLEKLNGIPGVQGSMVITRDGIMVAAQLGDDMNEDAIAALSSSLVLTLKRTFDPVGKETEPEEMILTATEGKLVFLDLGNAFLVVVTQPQLRLSSGLVEIRGVARKLRSLCVM